MNHPRVLGAMALVFLIAEPVSAQSLFSTRGLGVPAPAVDARAAALGGIGVGLIGFHTSLINPAEIAGVTRRGVSAALQPVSSTARIDGEEDGTSGTRFPLMRILYPVGERGVFSVAYGSYLEQSWAVESESVMMVDGREVNVTDVRRSTGGIAQLRVGGAYSVSRTFAVGVAAGLLTGNVERVALRRFSGDSLTDFQTSAALGDFEERLRWNYLAPMGAVGIRWDLAGRFRIGASAMVAGELEANGRQGGAEDRTYGAPMELAAGASARLSPLVLANAGAVWSRMPDTEGETVSRETIRVGAGLEYQGVRSGMRTYPVRIGARWSQLPYHMTDETAPTEWAAGFGLGFRLGDPANPAAVADIGVERGARNGLAGGTLQDGLREQHWRFTFSLSLFGN
jgi:hypothetical protein